MWYFSFIERKILSTYCVSLSKIKSLPLLIFPIFTTGISLVCIYVYGDGKSLMAYSNHDGTPLKNNTTDSSFLFDNDDAIIFDIKRKDNN